VWQPHHLPTSPHLKTSLSRGSPQVPCLCPIRTWVDGTTGESDTSTKSIGDVICSRLVSLVNHATDLVIFKHMCTRVQNSPTLVHQTCKPNRCVATLHHSSALSKSSIFLSWPHQICKLMMSATSPSLAICLTKALKFLTFVQYLGCEQTKLLVRAYIYHNPRF
jgi:hypothetical protein